MLNTPPITTTIIYYKILSFIVSERSYVENNSVVNKTYYNKQNAYNWSYSNKEEALIKFNELKNAPQKPGTKIKYQLVKHTIELINENF